MSVSQIDNFESLFETENYVLLKNYFYNYLLRKKAVEKNITISNQGFILEVGNGLFHRMNVVAPLFKWVNVFYAGLAWLDAKIMPRSLATILLIRAKKHDELNTLS